MPIELTNAKVRSAIVKAGIREPSPGKLHLCGVRGATVGDHNRQIARTDNRPNRYNDAIIVFGEALEAFCATTDPGATFTKRPANPKGCAHLEPGGPYFYQRGIHRGKRALVQASGVEIRRDRDRDGVAELGEPVYRNQRIGLNIHRGAMLRSMGKSGTIAVGSWSAGCQVIVANWWPLFWQHIEDTDQVLFAYYLVQASAFEWGD